MTKAYLVIILMWVMIAHLLLYSCDQELANSGLKPAVGWRQRAPPDSGGIPTMSGSTLMVWLVSGSASQHTSENLSQLLLPPPQPGASVSAGRAEQRAMTNSCRSLLRADRELSGQWSCDRSVLSLIAVGGQLKPPRIIEKSEVRTFTGRSCGGWSHSTGLVL